MHSLKQRLLEFYQKHQLKFHLGAFILGFVFDYFAAQEIDHLFVILQQVFYLVVVALILTLEYLMNREILSRQKLGKVWDYSGLALHFVLGTLLNLYSFFFFKSASLFSSVVFVLILIGLVVANELPQIRKSHLNIRWALWVLCLFSFFSVLFPLILGFVGSIPFLLAASATVLSLYLHFRILGRLQKDLKDLTLSFLRPGVIVIALFVGLYFMGWVPPVPLAAKGFGVYHQLEKKDGQFILSYERPWWKFWQNGDQDFVAQPGDPIYFFARIFSPAKFSDEVTIHWLYKDPRQGWMTSDKVKMQIHGGREEGFRGYSVKQNYQAGAWRVQVETTDGREIGRLYFDIIPATAGSAPRVYSTDIY